MLINQQSSNFGGGISTLHLKTYFADGISGTGISEACLGFHMQIQIDSIWMPFQKQ